MDTSGGDGGSLAGDGSVLRTGDTGEGVARLQKLLARWGFDISADEVGRRLFGPSTRVAVQAWQRANGLLATGFADDRTTALFGPLSSPTADDERTAPDSADDEISNDVTPRTVSGQVVEADGRPVPAARVQAFAVRLRDEEPLGEAAVTDPDGRYTVVCPPRNPGDPADLDLRVQAFSASGEELAASPVRFAAGDAEIIDLTVPPAASALSEYERHLADLRPALGPVRLAEVTGDEISFLTGDTGIPADRLQVLVDASRRASTSRSEGLRPLPADVWYAWQRAGIDVAEDALWQRPVDELIGAVRVAAEQGIVPADVEERIDGLTTQLRQHRLDHLLDQPLPTSIIGTGNGGRAALRDLLAALPTPLEAPAQRAVAEVLVDRTFEAEPVRLSRDLQEAGLPGSAADSVVRAVRLADLADGHVPLVADLQPLAGDGVSLRPLASVPADTLLDLAYEHGVPSGEGAGDVPPAGDARPTGAGSPEVDFARRLYAKIEELHPTATLTARLAGGGSLPNIPGGEEVAPFLERHPDFDVLATPIDPYLEQIPPDPATDPARIATALRAVRGLRTLATTWDDTAVLADAGLVSAFDIAGKDPADLVRAVDFRIEEPEARAIQVRATAMQNATVAVMGMLPRFSGTPIAAIPAAASSQELRDRYPTLQALFGSLDSCACGHCRSVLSPAAYLVDVLELLRKNAGEAFSVLMNRRPDLADLELSCENSEHELPAVDLALEVLENAIALPLTVPLPAGTDVTAALAGGALPEPVTDVLRRTARDVAGGLVATKEPEQLQREGFLAWTVQDRWRRWTLHQTSESLYAIPPWLRPGQEPLSLPGLDTADTVAALDRGELPSALDDRLRAAAMKDSFSRASAIPRDVVEVEAGRRWRVQYVVEMHVVATVPPAGPGRITVSTAGGTVVVEKVYSPQAVMATATALADGRAGGMLTTVLAAPSAFTVDPSSGGGTRLRRRLEFEVVFTPSELTVAALTYQSSRPEEDLRAYPQNLNPAAYPPLRTGVFPWSLPFDLPLAETRALLARARYPRLALMELLAPAERLTDLGIAQERLGLTPGDAGLITTPKADDALWSAWGLRRTGNEWTVADASAGADVTGSPFVVLARLSVVLRQARVSHPELLDLLGSRFVLGGGTAPSTLPANECRPSVMRLEPVDAGLFDRLHRFVRLRRALGWSVADLDVTLRGLLVGGEITTRTLLALSHLVRLGDLLQMPVAEIAQWWSGIGTTKYEAHTEDGSTPVPSLFDRLFREPSARAEPDPDLILNGARDRLAHEEEQPAAEWPRVAAKLGEVAAAFGAREADLAVLLAALPLRPVVQPRPGVPPVPAETQPLPLTLDTLSRLYRSLRLSRALGLTATEYVTAILVTGIEPFPLPSGTPAVAVRTRATLEFAEAVRLISDSGYGVAELAYLLRHESAPGLAVVVAEAQLAATLAAARSAARNARDASGGAASTPADLTALRDRQVAAAVAALAPATGLTDETLRDLLMGRLSVPGGQEPALTALLDPAFVDGDPDVVPQPGAFSTAFALLRRIHKIALLASRLGFGRAQLGWLASTGPGQAGGPALGRGLLGIDPNSIPVDAAEPALDFLAFRRTLAVARLRDRSPAMAGVLARYVTDVIVPGFDDAHRTEALSAATGVLTSALGVSDDTANEAAARTLPTAADFGDPIVLTRLFDLVTALAELGVTAAQLAPLTAVDPPFADAESAAATARALLRSRYGDGAWPDIIRPVSDGLRTRQRDALVDFLVHRDGLAGADELYERYLIDVLTAPAVTSTRLLAATAAVQLFVQRCLIGLESVPISETVRRRWEWTKNYRVWEANRKVFLWPQNWLHPELREDASEAFRAVEATLAQDEPSSENARTALLGYLDDLVELSQLSIVGMYQHRHGPADGDPWDLYLVGRTAGTPYRYFWRCCESFGGADMRWQPWERVDLDIAGTHVMPFVLDGDLHLAWPVFRKNQTTPPGEWEMQLAWARRTSRGWSKKNVSRDTARHPALATKDEPRSFTFGLSVQILPLPPTTSPLPLISSIVERVAVITCNAATEADLILPCGRQLARSSGEVAGPDRPGLFSLKVNVRVLRHKPALGLYWPAAGVDVTLTLNVPSFAGLPASSYPKSISTDSAGKGSITVRPSSYPGGNGTVALYFAIGFACNSFTLTALGQSRDFPVNQETAFSQKEWDVEFVQDVPEDTPVPDGRADPDRAVTWKKLGSFTLGSHRDATWSYGAGPDLLQTATGDVYENGRVEGPRSEESFKVRAAPNDASTEQVLPVTPGQYRAVQANPVGTACWHYRDDAGRYVLALSPGRRWLFVPDGQPLAERFRANATGELSALFSPDTERTTDGGRLLSQVQQPAPLPAPGSFTEQGVTFDGRSAFAGYNWELFLHVPVLVAQHLSRQQRFAEAEEWLRLVFDPTSDEARSAQKPDPALFWRFWPFRQDGRPDRIEDLVTWLADPAVPDAGKEDFRRQIARWLDNPFRPHEVARLRPGAYQWDVVFAYLDNLLDWGDDRFRRDTRETLVEATMLYVRAAKILGPRPRLIQPGRQSPPLTYRALHGGRWDDFSNIWHPLADTALVQALIRQWMAWLAWLAEHGVVGPSTLPAPEAIASLLGVGTTYFGVPANDKLVEYWDRVADRLFKIRHSQNIEGVERELALYDPPIDPEVLVRAVAAGVDIGQALAFRDRPLSQYRFAVLAQKATELCGEVKALGAAVLAAREKKDAEALARLRSEQEVGLLELVEQVRTGQVTEAQANIEALVATRDTVASRYRHYQYLLTGGATKEPSAGTPVTEAAAALQLASSADLTSDTQGLGLTQSERNQLGWLNVAGNYAIAAGIANTIAGILHASGSWETITKAGLSLGNAAGAVGTFLGMLSGNASSQAGRDAIVAGYQRRRDDWTFQSNAALRELAQLDKQVAAAQLRLAIAQRELSNHQQQMTNAREVDEFMRGKYSNAELYTWMGDQLRTVYFGAYSLALDLAKRAEQAFQFELYQSRASFVRPRYWDSLRGGLLAGDQLAADLKRMEVAYLEGNRREHELSRNISLRQLDPAALLELRATGTCEFSVPEALFDLDSPGHFLRRLKSVALSMPCTVGRYTGVHPKLTLSKSEVRHEGDPPTQVADYPRDGAADARFTDDSGPDESVVASGALDASGLWEPSLRDERRMPFEGRGAISTWRVELPAKYRQFDYASITDVVLHLRYSARYGGEELRDAAVGALDIAMGAAGDLQQVLLLSAQHDFRTAWSRFRAADAGSGVPGPGNEPAKPRARLTLDVRREHYPYLAGSGPITLTGVGLLVVPSATTVTALTVTDRAVDMKDPAGENAKTRAVLLTSGPTSGYLQGTLGQELPPDDPRRPWSPLPSPVGDLSLYVDTTAVDDVFILLTWTA